MTRRDDPQADGPRGPRGNTLRVAAALAVLLALAAWAYRAAGGNPSFPPSPARSAADERARAWSLYQQGHVAPAVEAFTRALALEDDPLTRTRLANAQAKLGLIDEAAANYRRVLAAHPEEGIVWYDYANLLRERQHDLRAALDAYRRATELSPTLAEAHLHLGEVLLALQQPVDAGACFEAALQLAPADAAWRADAERLRVEAHLRARSLGLEPAPK